MPIVTSLRSKQDSSKCLPPWALITFTLFWCLLSFGSAGILLAESVVSIRAQFRYLPVSATVISSKVVFRPGGKHGRCEPKIVYQFTVNGTTFQSDHISVGTYGSSNDAYANRVASLFPAGAPRTAYVDRNDPSHSLLLTGLDARVPLWLLFLTPFLAMGVGVIWGIWTEILSPYFSSSTRVAPAHEQNVSLRSPLGAAFAVLFLGGFGASIALMVIFDMDPPLTIAGFALATVYGSAAIVAAIAGICSRRRLHA